MSIDERVRTGLAELASEVRPIPDPWGRLLARRRRVHYGRSLGASLAVVTAVVLATVAVTTAPGQHIQPPPHTDAQYWMRRLVEANARGAAATPQFVTALAGALTEQNRAGTTDANVRAAVNIPVDLATRVVRVLYVDDVGAFRAAVVAMVAPDYQTHDMSLEDNVMVTMLAPRGTDAETLAAAMREGSKPAGTNFQAFGIQPFVMTELAPADQPPAEPIGGVQAVGPAVALGLAPPECTVSTAAWPAVNEWHNAPAGSYVVRSPQERRAEWWRVSCDGLVKQADPAPAISDPDNPDNVRLTPADVAAAVAAYPGADATAVGFIMKYWEGMRDYFTTKPTVLWSGRVSDGTMVIMVAPHVVGGGWTGFVNTTLDDKGAVDDGTGGATFETATDPHGQFLAIQMGSQTRILALPPPGTVSIRAVDNGQTLGEAPVLNGVGIVAVPQLQIFSATVQAVNASGAVTAEVKQCRPQSVEDINLWNDLIEPGPSNS